MRREHREIGAEPVPGRAQRIGRARREPVRKACHGSVLGPQHHRGERRERELERLRLAVRRTAQRCATAAIVPDIAAAIEARSRCWRSRASARRAARRCDSDGAAPASCCRRRARAWRRRRPSAGRRTPSWRDRRRSPSGSRSRRRRARCSAGSVAIEPVEVAHQPLDAAHDRGSSSRCQSSSASWFHSRPLGDLAAHEQQLLAGMRPHEAVIGAQVGELLPAIARHLADQRALCRAPPRRATAAG